MVDVVFLFTGIFFYHLKVTFVLLVQLHDVFFITLESLLKSADYSEVLFYQLTFVVVFPNEFIYLLVHALIFLDYLLGLCL